MSVCLSILAPMWRWLQAALGLPSQASGAKWKIRTVALCLDLLLNKNTAVCKAPRTLDSGVTALQSLSTTLEFYSCVHYDALTVQKNKQKCHFCLFSSQISKFQCCNQWFAQTGRSTFALLIIRGSQSYRRWTREKTDAKLTLPSYRPRRLLARP